MSIINEKYSANRINMLYQMLVNDANQGQPRDYDIKVDDLKIVQRTDDPERFYQHEEFVQPDTQCITISIYDGNSRRCTKYQLYFGEVRPNGREVTLSGIENTIQEKITNERRQWEYEQIKKENEELEKQLSDAEEYSDELEKALSASKEALEALKQKRVSRAEMSTGNILGFTADYLSKNHSAIATRFPILSGLSGFLSGDDNSTNLLEGTPITPEGTTETKAAFSKQKSPESAAPYDEATQARLAFFRKMEGAFTPSQLKMAVEIIEGLAAEPEQLESIHELLYGNPGPDNPEA